jgi:hypothetical protein
MNQSSIVLPPRSHSIPFCLTMACVSSTHHPHRIHGYPNDHMREQLPMNSNEMRTPSMQIKRAYRYHHNYHHYHHHPHPPSYHLTEYRQHPIHSLRQEQYAVPFAAAKSPISMSFATIIGAGTFESRVFESNDPSSNNLSNVLL